MPIIRLLALDPKVAPFFAASNNDCMNGATGRAFKGSDAKKVPIGMSSVSCEMLRQ